MSNQDLAVFFATPMAALGLGFYSIQGKVEAKFKKAINTRDCFLWVIYSLVGLVLILGVKALIQAQAGLIKTMSLEMVA
jgi:hypothetical protein